MNKKILYGFLPFFLSFVVLFVPMRVAAASDWNGPVSFAEEYIRIMMEQTTVTTVPQTNVTNGTGIKQASVTYHGQASNILKIGGLSGSSVIDGTLVLYGSIPLTASTSNLSVGPPTLVFDADTPDGITFGGYIRSTTSSSVNYAIEVQFNEFYSTADTLNIPFIMDIRQMMIYTNLDPNYIASIVSSYNLNFQFGGEWAGLIDVYTDLQDNPSMDGYFAEQNQQIIDNSQTQINNQQTIIQDIQNQTNQQHSDSQAEINQSIQNTDQITNGFDNSAGSAAADRLEDSTSSLENAENSLFGQVSDADEDYTDLTNFFSDSSVIESFSFVKSAMESIFTNLGDFSVPITIGFMFIILTRILGYQQFTSGGG